MFLSQKTLQLVTFLGIVSFAYALASETTEKERAVSEVQFMHNKGTTIQEVNRQKWLQDLMNGVHSAGRRDVSLMRSLLREARGGTTGERSVAEIQLMHDKGKTAEELDRQAWLQNLLEKVHSPGRRTLSMLTHNKERAVSEVQFMHDKGKTIQEVNRQKWLQDLMNGVHSAGRRDVSLMRSLLREARGGTTGERSVAEIQLMHDKGKTAEELDRQAWLQNLLEKVHSSGRRTLSMLTHNKERAVSEVQFMHDKGKTIQEVNRQKWLQDLMNGVHSAGRRDVSLMRSLLREVQGISTEEQRRMSVMKNNRNLQYKSEISAYSKKMTE